MGDGTWYDSTVHQMIYLIFLDDLALIQQDHERWARAIRPLEVLIGHSVQCSSSSMGASEFWRKSQASLERLRIFNC